MVTLFLGDKNSDYYMPGTIDELAKNIVKVKHFYKFNFETRILKTYVEYNKIDRLTSLQYLN